MRLKRRERDREKKECDGREGGGIVREGNVIAIQSRNMIEICDLTIRNRQKTMISSLNFSLREGDSLSILGPSGIGKSTLSFAVLGEIAEGLFLESGTVRVDGKPVIQNGRPVKERDLRLIRRIIGHLDQDPAASLTPTLKIRQLLRELSADKKTFKEECKEILKTFDLPTDHAFLNRYPGEISGGQKRRLALARVLLRRPKLLILDEPTAGLDDETRENVLGLLNVLIAKLKATVLVITHDRYVAKTLSSKFCLMADGTLKAIGINEGEIPKGNVASGRQNTKIILDVKGLTAKAPLLDKPPVKDFSFCVYEGEVLGLMGPSGSGKTTVVRSLLGLWPPLEGDIIFKQKKLAIDYRLRSEAEIDALAWVPQDPKTSFNPAVKLDKAMRRANKGKHDIDDVLAGVGLSGADIKGVYPDQLSGGQLQRLAIARALLGGAEFLLLDEVTSSLDEKTKDDICDLIIRLKSRISMLLVTHDRNVAYQVCDRLLDLNSIQLSKVNQEDRFFRHHIHLKTSSERLFSG
jgi:peptide/nickel transport system ATP-binding protein